MKRYNRFGGINRGGTGDFYGNTSPYQMMQSDGASDLIDAVQARRASGESWRRTPQASKPQAPSGLDAMDIEALQVARIQAEFKEQAMHQLIVDELIRRGIQV